MSKFWWETPLGRAAIEDAARLRTEQTAALARRSAPRRRRSSVGTRGYQAAQSSRFTSGWGASNSSADSELVQALTLIRSRSRSLVRDASYAKRAQVIVVNNVIGQGIGMQAQVMSTRGDLNVRVNDGIEEAWTAWSIADNCHTGGTLAFPDFERACLAQIFEAGEVFIRKHYAPFGQSQVPFALELIEAERIADDFQAIGPVVPGAAIRMGVELDQYYRPLAYWVRERHPGEIRWVGATSDQLIRVPAEQMIHLKVVTRWPQTRGEPWLHTAVRRLYDMDGYSEAEIERARAQAVRMGIIETPEDASDFAEEQEDGSFEMEIENGIVTRLNPGEQWKDSTPTAPNPQLDPFMRYMVREVAAGAGVSYESLSRDYSQSNYSSSRLSLLDDRDCWRALQLWFVRCLRQPLHREWLRMAVLARVIPGIALDQYGLNAQKFESVMFKPRGWGWIDPTKEVAAYKEAIKAGLTTNSHVIQQTGDGRDIEDVLTERDRELKLMKEKGLVFDTSPEAYLEKPGDDQVAEPKEPEEPDPDDDSEETESETPEEPARRRVFPFRRN